MKKFIYSILVVCFISAITISCTKEEVKPKSEEMSNTGGQVSVKF